MAGRLNEIMHGEQYGGQHPIGPQQIADTVFTLNWERETVMQKGSRLWKKSIIWNPRCQIPASKILEQSLRSSLLINEVLWGELRQLRLISSELEVGVGVCELDDLQGALQL